MDFYSAYLDQELLNAYLQTDYVVPELSLTIKIGQKNAVLDRFLKENNMCSWGFITAWNPRSLILPTIENKRRQELLIRQVQAMDKPFFYARGESTTDKNWDAEESLLILHLSREEGVQLGEQFEQYAFVYGEINREAELVFVAKNL